MSKLDNKIEARHRNLFDVLNAQKYTVDYFQREYSWGEMILPSNSGHAAK